MFLAGDIGGTNTRLVLYDGKCCTNHKRYKSGDFKSLKEIVALFLEAAGAKVEKACFGIAGPIRNQKCRATNLPWIVERDELSSYLKIPNVFLVNDLEANANGIALLEKEEFLVLNKGDDQALGNQALISPGTGFGQAGLYFDGEKHHPFACEGGHCDFAPRNAQEDALLLFLRKKWGHVSYERIISGPGLYTLFEFLLETKQIQIGSDLLKAIKEGKGRAISELGIEKKEEACLKVLRMFVSILGAECGNAALKFMALGGVFIGGGIVPKIAPLLKEGAFMQAFVDKGRFGKMLEDMPVKILLNDQTALLGAGRYAMHL